MLLPESGTVRDALRQTEFVVVVDTHPTDTTDLAEMAAPTARSEATDLVTASFDSFHLPTHS